MIERLAIFLKDPSYARFSVKKSAFSNTYQLSLLISIEYSVTIILQAIEIILRP